MPSISLDTIVGRSDKQAHCFLDDRAVLMDVDSGKYFELNVVASRLWLAIESPVTVARLVDALVADYEVESPACEEAVLEWLTQMSQLGFVELSDPKSI